MNRVAILSCSTLAFLLISGCAIEPGMPSETPVPVEPQTQPVPQSNPQIPHSPVSQQPQPVPARPNLAHCDAAFGDLDIKIADNSPWMEALQARHLPSPESALQAIAEQSGCFRLSGTSTSTKTPSGHFILKPEISFGQTGLRRILSSRGTQEHHDATALLALAPASGKGFMAASGHSTDIIPDADWKELFTNPDEALNAYEDSESGRAALSALLDAYNQLVLTVRHNLEAKPEK